MSEPKKCPMTFQASILDGRYWDCIQGKCAWWIEAVMWGPNDNVEPTKWDYTKTPGHCVALDLGKP